jgi:hypothetical protein
VAAGPGDGWGERRGDGVNVLETRYRSLLRLLPASYREQWEEQMVGTFLDGMHADHPDEADDLARFGRPPRTEVVSVVSLAVRLRLGGADAPPRPRLWGEGVRLFALVGLLVHALGAATGLLQELWLFGTPGWPVVPGALAAIADTGPISRWSAVATLTGSLWIVAFAAQVTGRWGAARVVAAAAVVPTLVATVVSTLPALWGAGPLGLAVRSWTHVLLLEVLVVAALAAFHRDAPRERPRPWLIASGVGLVLVLLPAAAFLWDASRDRILLDWAGVYALALVAAGAFHLWRATGPLGRRQGPPPRRAAWVLALSLWAVPVVTVRLVSLLTIVATTAPDHGPGYLAFATVQLLAASLMGVALSRIAVSELRARVPPVATQVDPTPAG